MDSVDLCKPTFEELEKMTLGSPSLTVRTVCVDVKQHWILDTLTNKLTVCVSKSDAGTVLRTTRLES